MGMPTRGIGFRFAGFVLEVQERRFWEGERKINLRPKTLDTLIFLVSHQGRLVTKEELLDGVWSDVEVTENTLVQSISELREALRDDAKKPRFIQTVKPAGYRFVAQVEPAPEPLRDAEYEELAAVSFAVLEDNGRENGFPHDFRTAHTNDDPAVSLPRTTSSAARGRHKRSWVAYGTAGIVALAVLTALLYWFYPRKTIEPLARRDWILIADFDNYTGKPVFDAALRTALEREFSLSRYVNLVPRARVTDALRMMRRSVDTRVTEEVGREICLRDGGIHALLCGSVQEIGGVYAISLRVVDPANGGTLAILNDRAASAQETLTTIQNLASDLRGKMGESLKDISRSDRPMPRVTTRSLEALDLFSRSGACLERLDYGQAESYINQAIAADPEFAMSHNLRGVIHFMTYRDSSADFRRAAELARTASVSERLSIEAANALVNERNLTRAIDLLRSVTEQFPNDYGAHEMLSWCYLWAGSDADWSKHQDVVRRLRPNSAEPGFHVGWVHLFCDGDLETARAEFKQAQDLDPEFSGVTPKMFPAIAQWMGGDLDKAESAFQSFLATQLTKMSAPAQVGARPYVARFFSFAGKSADALALLESNRGMTFPIADGDIAARFRFERALLYEDLGDYAKARRLMQEEAADRVGTERVEALGWLGIFEARRGRFSEARRLQNELSKETRLPMVTFWTPPLPQHLERGRRAFNLAIDGEILLFQKKPDEAIERFEEVLKIVSPDQALFSTMLSPRIFMGASLCLGVAHELRGDWGATVRAYESILRNKHLCLGTPAAAPIYVAALRSISTALEKSARTAEAAIYLKEYLSLRPRGPAR